jgi:hypothetical protein
MRRQRLDHPPSFKSVASDVFAILDWSHNEAIQPVRRSLNPPLILLGQGASGHLMLGACSEEDSRLLLRGFNHGLLAVAFPNLGKVIEKSRRESSPRSNRAADCRTGQASRASNFDCSLFLAVHWRHGLGQAFGEAGRIFLSWVVRRIDCLVCLVSCLVSSRVRLGTSVTSRLGGAIHSPRYETLTNPGTLV